MSVKNLLRNILKNGLLKRVTPRQQTRRGLMAHNINHIMNKKVFDRYVRLPLPCEKVLATYVWIDGSGVNMRSKDRILRCVPATPDSAPDWAFDGSSCGLAATDNSDTKLNPVSIIPDPFRCAPHIIVLCDVYEGGSGKPVKTNHRNFCADLAKCYAAEEPWFGLEQEFTMLDMDLWGLGWPKGGGFPAVKYEFSYCGVGAKYIAGRDVMECHTRACLYSGLDYEGTNAEVMFACWEWQIGHSVGMKAPDDLWLSRYLMSRVGEDFGAVITYHPKPMGMLHPGVGMHHNFSTKKMRNDGGWAFIQECLKRLEKNHMKHMVNYGADEMTNRMRLSGQFETSPFDKFSWGIANRKTSIRLPRNIDKKGKGFLEDRRPGGDCDPYLVCGLLMQTCLAEGK